MLFRPGFEAAVSRIQTGANPIGLIIIIIIIGRRFPRLLQ